MGIGYLPRRTVFRKLSEKIILQLLLEMSGLSRREPKKINGILLVNFAAQQVRKSNGDVLVVAKEEELN